jgi:hypothetical protein
LIGRAPSHTVRSADDRLSEARVIVLVSAHLFSRPDVDVVQSVDPTPCQPGMHHGRRQAQASADSEGPQPFAPAKSDDLLNERLSGAVR